MRRKQFPFLKTYDLKTDEIELRLDQTFEGDEEKGWAPSYRFFICSPKGEEMGVCDLRVGYSENLYYAGNIGYTVYEGFRGRHYAAKACLLLFTLARRHGMKEVIITCNPDNIASYKTCEWVGCELVEIVEVPEGNDMRERGETHKRIYRMTL
jgi:predicted acetyltransferase